MTYQFVAGDASWEERAVCRGMPAWWWDLIDVEGRTGGRALLSPDNRKALRLCRSCPVRRECLAAAIESRSQGVVRGGYAMGMPWEWGPCEGCGRRFARAAGQESVRRKRCTRCVRVQVIEEAA